MQIEEIRIEKIETDGLQCRAAVDNAYIVELSEAWAAGVLPPLVVFSDGWHYWLADGHQRLAGAKLAGRTVVPCEIWQGSRRDAFLFALQANRTHGARRTNADKHHAVRLALADDELAGRSDRDLAELIGVSNTFVGIIRREVANCQPLTVADRATVVAANCQRIEVEPEQRLGRDRKMRRLPQKPVEQPRESSSSGDSPDLPNEQKQLAKHLAKANDLVGHLVRCIGDANQICPQPGLREDILNSCDVALQDIRRWRDRAGIKAAARV